MRRAQYSWVSCTSMAVADVNYKKAIEWYEEAAEQGHTGSVVGVSTSWRRC